MIEFIDDHREDHEVEPICNILSIASSTYHNHVVKRADQGKLSVWAKRDMALKPEITRVFKENFAVYGVRKVWRRLKRETFEVAPCTVEKLMQNMGLRALLVANLYTTPWRIKKPIARLITSIASSLCTCSQQAVDVGLYLCLDLGRDDLCGFRCSCLRLLHRGLAGETNRPCRLCT